MRLLPAGVHQMRCWVLHLFPLFPLCLSCANPCGSCQPPAAMSYPAFLKLLFWKCNLRARERCTDPHLHPLQGALCRVPPAAPAPGCRGLQEPGSFRLSAQTLPQLVQTVVAKNWRCFSLLFQEELNCWCLAVELSTSGQEQSAFPWVAPTGISLIFFSYF